jgi:hypothetical protein
MSSLAVDDSLVVPVAESVVMASAVPTPANPTAIVTIDVVKNRALKAPPPQVDMAAVYCAG